MARAGSKRLPGKNTKVIASKPLCEYTFELMEKNRLLNERYSFSDDPTFNELAKNFHISTKYCRPNTVSNALCSSEDTLHNFVTQYLESNATTNRRETHIVLLQPTSPLREIYHLNLALDIYSRLKPDSLVSGYILDGKFKRNGAIYIVNLESFINTGTITPGQPFEFLMTKDESIDIDTLADFKLAEKILLERTHDKNNR